MKQPLHAKVPSFIGDTNINLSWKEATKPLPSATTTIGFVAKLTQIRNLSIFLSFCNLYWLYCNIMPEENDLLIATLEVVTMSLQRGDEVRVVCQTSLWTRLFREYHLTVVVEEETEDAEVVAGEDKEEVTGNNKLPWVDSMTLCFCTLYIFYLSVGVLVWYLLVC